MSLPIPRRLARSASALALSAAALSGCVVGPNYQRPSAPVSATFKEAQGWRPAQPMDTIDRGAWWSVYSDPVLDSLERRVAASNQTLAQSEAAYRQAHAAILEARSGYFPQLSASAGATHSQSFSGGNGGGPGGNGGGTNYSASLDGNWAPDFWGRVRRTVEAARANAQASAADLASVRLSLQAQLATAYLDLRVVDEESRVYQATVAGYLRVLQMVQNQYNVGTAARADVISAQTQLQSAQATLISLAQQRALFEHAIANLVGVPPAELTISPTSPLAVNIPVAPIDVASTLLERRPDIAAAERNMQASNAQVGIAISAYYPNVTLSGSLSTAASTLGSLFSASTSFWSVGAQAADVLLDFGARRSRVQQARAAYDQSVAEYRQTVLNAFQGVEDQLASLRVFEQEAAVRTQQEASARLAEQLALNRYRAGQVDFSAVITAQQQALSAELSSLAVQRSRLEASVTLIQDLGGGWTTADLPKG